jgi:hypothetical protein
MTLAVILFNVWFALSVATQAQAPSQSAQSSKPADTAPTQDQGNPQQQNPPASQPAPAAPKPAPKSSSTPKQQKGAQPDYRKRARPPDCDPAPAATSAPSTSDPPTKTPADSSASKSATTAAKPPATPPNNCPPPKIVVQQGSTAEPTIQLEGGDATSHQRDAANEMLAATDANLKKIEGTQLSSSQQDIVAQIRQFMDQSKKATAAGDTEQAHTLAWKAKTLSEELIAPPK